MYLSSHMNTLSSSLPTVLTSQHLLSSPFFHFSSGRSPEAVMRDRMRISLTIQSQIQSSVCSLNVHTYKHSLSLQSHSLFPASLWCDSGHLTIWLWEFAMNEFNEWMNSKKSVFIAKLWMWELWRIFNRFHLLLLMWHPTPTSLHRDSDHLVPAVAGWFYLKVD